MFILKQTFYPPDSYVPLVPTNLLKPLPNDYFTEAVELYISVLPSN